MNNPHAGRAFLTAGLSLFAAFTIVAWHQDSKVSQKLYGPHPEHVCHRLATELNNQVRASMITPLERAIKLNRCWIEFYELKRTTMASS